MMIGASPAGTGRDLWTTTFAVTMAIMRSKIRGSARVTVAGRIVDPARQQRAAASLGLWGLLLALALVGLSMGVTGSLSDIGKLLVILLMTAGRVGILSFGVALATRAAVEPAAGPAVLAMRGRGRAAQITTTRAPSCTRS